jgi:hypothetical protein
LSRQEDLDAGGGECVGTAGGSSIGIRLHRVRVSKIIIVVFHDIILIMIAVMRIVEE